MLLNIFSTFSIECPIKKSRLNRRAPELNTLYFTTAIVKIGYSFWNEHINSRLITSTIKIVNIHEDVMVTSNNNLVLMRLSIEPIEELNTVYHVSVRAEIAGMDKNISIRKRWQLQMQAMSIRYCYNSSHFSPKGILSKYLLYSYQY